MNISTDNLSSQLARSSIQAPETDVSCGLSDLHEKMKEYKIVVAIDWLSASASDDSGLKLSPDLLQNISESQVLQIYFGMDPPKEATGSDFHVSSDKFEFMALI